jgi:hypothetical protein
MKKYLFLFILVAGLMACSTSPPFDEMTNVNETGFVKSDPVVTSFAVSFPEVVYTGYGEVNMYPVYCLKDLVFKTSFEPDQIDSNLHSVPEVIDIGNGDVMVYQASLATFVGDLLGDNVDIIAIALLIFTTLFGGLWFALRNKLKQVADLFLKAYEYTDDKKLSAEERADLKRRFLEIITKSPG